ncbi:metallophosphoesterase family protein [Pararcticibacter amylolyticus]|uniref:Metallophosphoesterase n=1 Tax=Pararcticibacter amylolyticus TaxID=2173175 RepID=A0A2U2PBH6_9SPHI|nr:metallophosphoesterase [Pararcticibacter amylolyticus]PWG78751.1 metallophosphoesterase [Pararcticibacter amylolyticus]
MNSKASLKHNTPVFKKDQPDDSWKFRPLPSPAGSYPYHLALKELEPEISDRKIVFHMVGDTGSIRNPDFQYEVAEEMTRQYERANSKEDSPLFLYHLGDIVYTYGEAAKYPQQFFEPYHNYPGHIFAIPGNHDADVNPETEQAYNSLDPFIAAFCSSTQQPIPFSGGSERLSMIQPNVYWTLETPLATIIGLYSNVPKYGVITAEQRDWLIRELHSARVGSPDKALILCLHHAPFSADVNHGSSKAMIEFLEDAFNEAGARPDIVFSGHVHNYQRFEKRYPDGTSIPFIVAGGGGYDELHSLAHRDDHNYTGESPLFDQVRLQNYCDDQHGFLKISIERQDTGLVLSGEFYSISHTQNDTVARLADRFSITI